jgi:hypothetical protein
MCSQLFPSYFYLVGCTSITMIKYMGSQGSTHALFLWSCGTGSPSSSIAPSSASAVASSRGTAPSIASSTHGSECSCGGANGSSLTWRISCLLGALAWTAWIQSVALLAAPGGSPCSRSSRSCLKSTSNALVTSRNVLFDRSAACARVLASVLTISLACADFDCSKLTI